MESGDHTDKFVSGSDEHSKLQQHADLGMMENLHKSEQLGFTGDHHIEHKPEEFVFGGGAGKKKYVPSKTDINQFILHESRSNVPTEGEVSQANKNTEEPSEGSKDENLSVAEKTHSTAITLSGEDSSRNVDTGANEHNSIPGRVLVPGDGQTVTEANTEEDRDSINNITLAQAKDESIISQDRRNDPEPQDEVAKDSDNTNLRNDTNAPKESIEIKKTDIEDFNAIENSHTHRVKEDFTSDQLSNNKSIQKEPVGLRSDVNYENENVKGSSKDSDNSFISNEKSEIQTKTESDEISEAETLTHFLSHEGDKKDSAERKQQNEFEDKHSNFIQSEKGDSAEDKEIASPEISENTHLRENQENPKSDQQEDTDKKTSAVPASKDETEEEWLDILGSGHLKKKIIKQAENDYRPQNSHICEINLEGRLEDGTVVEKFENLKIQVGDIEVIQGIDYALPLMNVGEVALLEVSPRFAYGNLGRSPDIPPNAKLVYTIELLSAEREPDLESLSILQRKEIGDKKRERGNWWYERQEYSFAIQSYRRAIEFLDESEGGFSIEKKEVSEDAEKQLQELLEYRLKVFNNLAAAQMKIKAYDAALKSVENVLRCQPQNVKALFRKGKILAAKGDTTGALSVLRNASQLEPESKVIKLEVQRLLDIIKHDTKQEKSLYKKMLGQNKSTEKTSSKGSKISYRTWGIVCSSVAVVLLGAVAYRYKFL